MKMERPLMIEIKIRLADRTLGPKSVSEIRSVNTTGNILSTGMAYGLLGSSISVNPVVINYPFIVAARRLAIGRQMRQSQPLAGPRPTNGVDKLLG